MKRRNPLVVPVGDFPLNDGRVYGLAVRSIFETGRFALPSPASANVFAQAYWGARFCLPFGFSFTALLVATAAGVAFNFQTSQRLVFRSRGHGLRFVAVYGVVLT